LTARAYPQTGASEKKGLSRSLAVLTELVAWAPEPMGVRDLSLALDVPASTVHRVLNLLVDYGWVTRAIDGRYAIGLHFQRLAWTLAERFGIREYAKPILARAVEDVDETARLILYDHVHRKRVSVLSVECKHPLRYLPPTGDWESLQAGAGSLAIIAFLSPEERAIVIRDGLPMADGEARLSQDEAERECAVIQSRGFALSHGGRLEGLVGIAAPILDGGGRVLGAVAMGIPESRHEPARDYSIGRRLRAAATELGNIVAMPSRSKAVPKSAQRD
jgi:DNA-binding IclR family transcriptional regulator